MLFSIKVADQHGMLRVCLLIPATSPHDDKARYNNHDGTYPAKAKLGQTVTTIFSCNQAKEGVLSAIAPGASVLEQKVMIPNPNAPSASLLPALSYGNPYSANSTNDDNVPGWAFHNDISISHGACCRDNGALTCTFSRRGVVKKFDT